MAMLTLCSLITVMKNIERIMDQMIMFVIMSHRVDFVQFYYYYYQWNGDLQLGFIQCQRD